LDGSPVYFRMNKNFVYKEWRRWCEFAFLSKLFAWYEHTDWEQRMKFIKKVI
jgi:hypothetical protein